jgi:hypothetical protein
MTKNTISNIWTAQERVLHLYKLLSFGMGILALVLVAVLAGQGFRNPIVVVKSGERQEFYPTNRLRTPLAKVDVEDFTRKFLSSLYVWNEFNPVTLVKEISPYVDENLIPKFVEAQSQRYLKELKGKNLQQAITFVKVEVQNDRVVCTFDRVLKIEGIPLIIPSAVTLWMTQGEPTQFNPMGIYITSITESDSAK